MSGDQRAFDIYGLTVSVGGSWEEVIRGIDLDFAWFRSEAQVEPKLMVEVESDPVDLARFGDVPAASVGSTSVVYRSPTHTITDYQGRACSVMDHRRRRLSILGEDPDLAYEAAHLAIKGASLAQAEGRGLLPLHALGLAGAQGAVALLLPSGGGKSTMAARAMASGTVRLLSDDAPLLDVAGRLHPFPLRVGWMTSGDRGNGVGPSNGAEVRSIGGRLKRMMDPLDDGWLEPAPTPLRHIVLGKRTLGPRSTLRRADRSRAVRPLLQEAVLRVGVGQGVGYVLVERKAAPTLRKVGKLIRRMRICARGLRGASVWELTMGRDLERCWEALAPLLR